MAVVAQPMSKPKPSLLSRYLPIFAWLPAYKAAWLGTDLIAGLTVVALLIPEGMAYAQIAGVPPEAAFYAAPIGFNGRINGVQLDKGLNDCDHLISPEERLKVAMARQ